MRLLWSSILSGLLSCDIKDVSVDSASNLMLYKLMASQEIRHLAL